MIFKGEASGKQSWDESESVRMTKREQDVIELIAIGRSNKEIAAELSIAIHTVKSHVHNIPEKLALHTRLELASFAHTKGMISKASGRESGNRE